MNGIVSELAVPHKYLDGPSVTIPLDQSKRRLKNGINFRVSSSTNRGGLPESRDTIRRLQFPAPFLSDHFEDRGREASHLKMWRRLTSAGAVFTPVVGCGPEGLKQC